jgi:hypothetical protein
MTHTHTPTEPVFTLGLHYFCDHRCWRCGLRGRCAVFARWNTARRARKVQFSGPGGRVASVLAVSLEVTMEEAVVLAAEAAKALPEGPMVPGQGARLRDRPNIQTGRAEQDPLVTRGRDYAQSSWPVLQALRPILAARGDAAAADAAERLEEMCATIASKIFRAVSSAQDDDCDASDIQTDSNGSAKVALLLIEESRQAWRALMQPGCALADGLPARFVAALDALETELLHRFPRALEFVRPGFDTGAEADHDSQLARALLKATGTHGQA